MEITRSRGFDGHFFLVSSKSDFKAAQLAIKYGADRYIVTPVEPAEFSAELKLLRQRIERQKEEFQILEYCKERTFREFLRDITVTGRIPDLNVIDFLGFKSDLYQAAILEPLTVEGRAAHITFSELIKNSGIDRISFDSFVIDGAEVILIKGSHSVEAVNAVLRDFATRSNDSTGFFLSLGTAVSSLSAVNLSYSQAKHTSDRKFLAPAGTFISTYESSKALKRDVLSDVQMSLFCRKFLDCLQTFKRHNVMSVTDSLRDYLVSTQASSSEVKLFLTDLLLQIKESFLRLYSTANIPFASNSEILTLIERKTFLHEVLALYSEQFDLIMSNIGGTSRDSVLDDIFYYISHNYSSPIKLESLASLFGYNSAYLGKIFHKAAGMSFNSYVDKLRVEHSIKLLRESDMKVYEIARQVGYKSVDYYHKKFRAITGESPAEYRKHIQPEIE